MYARLFKLAGLKKLRRLRLPKIVERQLNGHQSPQQRRRNLLPIARKTQADNDENDNRQNDHDLLLLFHCILFLLNVT